MVKCEDDIEVPFPLKIYSDWLGAACTPCNCVCISSKKLVLNMKPILLEIRRGENPRSQNRPSKTRQGAAESGFAGPVLGPWIEPSLISY